MFVSEKGKYEYLVEANKLADEKSAEYKKWDVENNMVMSWLINSTTVEWSQDFLLFETAAQIWEAAKENYSNIDNKAEIFGIKGLIHDLRQGDMTVTQYYTTLGRHWQQLDMYEKTAGRCTEDSQKYKEIMEEKRVFKFLYGLNRDLDDVRGRILASRPIPKVITPVQMIHNQEEEDVHGVIIVRNQDIPERSAGTSMENLQIGDLGSKVNTEKAMLIKQLPLLSLVLLNLQTESY
ncbi:UBN2_3 domain-containing protein [Quillaja saponaria]|uniref:UBN2_3 domain-containing protein n=1 Tax=Quillaja saponaria TaxID=32244 RepID=A0AAD7P5H4_QUISA|nr:UBN2_3 domain-containing protein [Quillaja saponaria]